MYWNRQIHLFEMIQLNIVFLHSNISTNVSVGTQNVVHGRCVTVLQLVMDHFRYNSLHFYYSDAATADYPLYIHLTLTYCSHPLSHHTSMGNVDRDTVRNFWFDFFGEKSTIHCENIDHFHSLFNEKCITHLNSLIFWCTSKCSIES